MAGCFLCLEIDNFGINASIIEAGYKRSLIKAHYRVLFQELPDLEDNSVLFDAGMDIVAQQLDLQPCSSAIILVSPLSVCFRNITLPFGSPKKIKQILPIELETLLPVIEESYISDFHMLDIENEPNLILSASIAETLVETYFNKLNGLGIKPLMITPGGYAPAIGFLRENKEVSTFAFLHIADSEISLVLVVNRTPVTVRAFPASQYFFENIVIFVKQTILGFNQRTGSDISFDIVISSDGDKPEAERIYKAFEATSTTGLKSKIDSHSLLLAISPDKSVKHLFNFCQGQYGSISFVKTYFPNIAAVVVLFICVFSLFMLSFSFDNSKLNKKIAVIDNKAFSIFMATFPDKKMIQDPYLQMKANVREAIKKSGNAGTKSHLNTDKDVKLVEILGELSKLIASSIDVDTSRLLFNTGRLVLSGSTDNFNNVDNIKIKIASSDLFEKVTISSAAADKKGNRVNFKFIIEM